MQRGTCFINYEDFKEFFTTYKKETQSSYSIHSAMSVQSHNAKFSTDIRPDVTFTEVKFCCSKLQGGKRKSDNGVCPSYFFLQYDMDLDRLVVKEECSTHSHPQESQQKTPSQESLIHSPKMVEHLSPNLEVPSMNICNKRLSVSPKKENDQPEVQQDIPSPRKPQNHLPYEMQDIGEGHSKCTSGTIIHPPKMAERLSPDFEIPSKKICDKMVSLSPKMESDQDEVKQDIPSPSKPQSPLPSEMQDIGEGRSASATIKDSSPEELFIDGIVRLDNFIKDFQKRDVGSKSSLTIGGQNQLEQLCVQTSSMGCWFLRFPESLLLHRTSSKHGYMFYAFLVETKDRSSKIVHVSFVKEDNAKNISKMLEMFKDFNSEWPKVKVFYTDMAFTQMNILKEAFPSVKVLLSVYHTARLIEKKIKGPAEVKPWVHKWVDDAIYNTTPQKLSFLSEKLEHKLDEDLYEKLCRDWFSNDLLWYMHVKKGILSCSTYIDSVGVIDETISSCLANQTSMENAFQEFLKFADCFNNKGLEKVSFPGISKTPKARPKKLRPLLPALQASPFDSEFSTAPMKKKKATRQLKKKSINNELPLGPKVGIWRPIRLANKMLLSLKEFCNDVGFQLCLKEWEFVQKSTHLINRHPNFTSVQILEETHSVSLSDHSCTCYFNTDYKLPCRHILSMLYAYEKPVEENMVSLRWRKKYIKPILDSRVYGKVLHYTKSKAEAMTRISVIKSLTKEIYNLLMQSDGSEMQVRVSTLQMIVDMWHSDYNGRKLLPAQDQTSALPYQWVKKEPIEGENNFGLELCMMNPKPLQG